MLREIPEVRQIPGEPTRRWFTGQELELIVWFSPANAVVGFQLCYELAGDSKAITWHSDQGFFHAKVDWGEDRWGRKETPILGPDGTFDGSAVRMIFEDCYPFLPKDIAEIIREKLTAGFGNSKLR